MNDSIDPNEPRWAVTCTDMPGAEELTASARALREQNPLWFFEDTYYENEQIMREIIEQAKEEAFLAWGL